MLTQSRELVRPEINTIERDTATGDIIKARNQLGDGALPTAGTAQEGNDLARRRAEGNIVQHRDSRTVTKAHMRELYPSCEMREGASLRGILDVGDGIENFKE